MTTKRELARLEAAWTMRAVNSFPVPGAPAISTRELAGPTLSITWRSWLALVERPTTRSAVSERVFSSTFSRFSRDVSSARSATSTSRSALNGFSMKS